MGDAIESRRRAELRELLMEHWDPIRVKDEPEAWDEYDRYVDALLARLADGADVDAVASYLGEVEAGQMELTSGPVECRDVGERVIAWYRRSR